jgi:esterase
MNLFYRKLGQGEPLIILHGLYGSSDNWLSIGRELAASHSVYLIDQRNHGNSPHHPDHHYEALSNDLNEFIDQHGIAKACFIGHSMGGKTALDFGLRHPEKVGKMVVVDISPFGYDPDDLPPEIKQHQQIMKAFLTLDTTNLSSREQADEALRRQISSMPLRKFLLKNLKRTPDGKFHWALNLSALADNLDTILAGIIHEGDHPSRFPLLFIKGGISGYLGSREERLIYRAFPWAQIVTIPAASHWVHAEQAGLFLDAIKNFV